MMVFATDELYVRQIKDLPVAERMRLLSLLAADLAEGLAESRYKRSILDLEGLGAELWQGVDAQEYVDSLREEWDQRP